MPSRTSKPSRAVRVQSRTVNQTRTALRNLPEKEKELLPLQEAIHQLRVPIKAALDKGYSHQEIAAMLQRQEILISVSTLKRYLALGKRAGSSSKSSEDLSSRSSKDLLVQPSSAVEVFVVSKTEIASVTVKQDFWAAFQASLQERGEVYRRLAES